MFRFKGNNRARELTALRPRHAKLTRVPQTTADLFRDVTGGYVQEAWAKMVELLQDQPTVSIDDVYTVCPPPEYVNRTKAMRHIFLCGDFKRVATVKTKRAGMQNRYIGVYALADNPTLASRRPDKVADVE